MTIKKADLSSIISRYKSQRGPVRKLFNTYSYGMKALTSFTNTLENGPLSQEKETRLFNTIKPFLPKSEKNKRSYSLTEKTLSSLSKERVTNAMLKIPQLESTTANITAVVSANKPHSPPKDSVDIDFDVASKNTTHTVQELFKPIGPSTPIAPRMYRLKSYASIKTNEAGNPVLATDIPTAVSLSNLTKKIVTSLSSIKLNEDKNENFYFVSCEIALDKKPVPLPSLNPQEELIELCSENNTKFTLSYDSNSNFYYLSAKPGFEESKVTVSYTLKIKGYSKDALTIPEALIAQIEYCKKFSPPKNPESTTDLKNLDHLYKSKLGACRHRVFAFLHKIQKDFPEFKNKVRAINNECHAFIEIKLDNGLWKAFDLGGYKSNLRINPAPLSAKLQASFIGFNPIATIHKPIIFNTNINTTFPLTQENLQIKNLREFSISVNQSMAPQEPISAILSSILELYRKKPSTSAAQDDGNGIAMTPKIPTNTSFLNAT